MILRALNVDAWRFEVEIRDSERYGTGIRHNRGEGEEDAKFISEEYWRIIAEAPGLLSLFLCSDHCDYDFDDRCAQTRMSSRTVPNFTHCRTSSIDHERNERREKSTPGDSAFLISAPVASFYPFG